MNKCKAPKIPPLLVNNTFVLNYREKAKLLTDFSNYREKPNCSLIFVIIGKTPNCSLILGKRQTAH